MNRSLSCALLLALAAGCTGGTTSVPRPAIRTFPGFDTGIYPGDATMRAWVRPNSPYHWVGYYLPAPCHRDSSWSGKRDVLAAMGWGMAVLYVGQQTWEGLPAVAPSPDTVRVPADTLRAEAPVQRSVTCSRTLLTAAQGTADADDAIGKTAADGFASGTRIFLDIERMTTVPPPMREYYRAWVGRVLADGRFRPAIYSHQRNAAEIYADVRAVFDAAGVGDEPSFWISSPASFTLTAAASDVGFRFARVWQGLLNTMETWNGVTVRVDVNVADSPSPSTAGPVVANANQGTPARTP